MWIPSHVNLKGNERADQAANKGREQQSIGRKIGLSPSEIKSISKNYALQSWQKLWDDSNEKTTKEFRKIVPKINTKIAHDLANKSINRLRINRPVFRIIDRKSACPTCNLLLTVDHVLLACPSFSTERGAVRKALETEKLPMEIHHILGIHKNKAIKKSVTNLINKIEELHQI